MNSETEPTKAPRKGLIGAVLAAVAASVCCVGPLVLLGLGIGGAWVGSLTAFEPFRPYFMGLTLIFLGYAFYKIYSKPKAEDCEPGSYCANPKADKINKIALWVVTAFVGVLLAVPYVTPMVFTESQKPIEINTEVREVVLDVPGMTCSACPVTIQKSLMKVDGVIEAAASFEQKNAVVKYDPTKISTRDLLEATRNAGFESTVH
ncbi:MAG: mercuric transporter MerT family protein [Fidelibacterota bacterium]